MRFRYVLFALTACLWATALTPSLLIAQTTFPQPAPSDRREELVAFTNATVYTDYKTRLEGATLLIRKGKVEACAANIPIPKEAVVHDCSGKTIYPSFIDPYAAGYGMPEQKRVQRNFNSPPQYESSKKGAFAWNEALKPEFSAAEVFSQNAKEADALRKAGFGLALTHQNDGISRGAGAVVALSDEIENRSLLRPAAAHHLSFSKGTSAQNYPSSLIGCIALLRQTYLDARWYRDAGYLEERNLSLEAWNRLQALPQIFEAGDKLDVLRAARLGQEFGVRYIVKTAGDEYQRLDAVKNTGLSLIVPLSFPEGYDVSDPYSALDVPLKDLKHWEMAPSNAARLEAAGINFAFTADGLRDKKLFPEALRKAVEYGLSPETALKALTWQPAQMLGIYTGELAAGSLEKGKLANFFIASGDIFQKDTKILDHWVLGKYYACSDITNDGKDLSGLYQLRIGNEPYELTIKGKPEAPEASLMRPDSSRLKAEISYNNGLITLSFQQDTTRKDRVTLTGEQRGNAWAGQAILPDGLWTNWSAERKGDAGTARTRKETPESKPETGELIYPFTAFGQPQPPKAGNYLIRNATVWTNENEGILKGTDVLVRNGKINRIGRSLSVQDDAIAVDGTGMHLTAGIIDEHSHIAVSRGINEGTQESSAEVRIGDALDSEDIDIYRQLAGGVTGSHLLHGSANPIGGQTQLIKMRWGKAPEELKFENWPGQIKFALGENVKQSNWGDNNRTRYPQTRMGVEQVFIDYFNRAQEYGRIKKSGKPYRADLELEALLEILESKRFITCHSYVQSEITMLMRVAEMFNFKVNTFTHILEGYKVADKMAGHGAGGSTFSDWWAYKYEVYHAIPYNAAIMHRQGVTVAINSDDAEMARRLNQEAAKAVMYGGVSEEEAWKMVTLNPAKLLHVDDRVGSIKVGKDADLVLWTDNPLSVYAQANKTWVDGALYFDGQTDVKLQEWVRTERARLVQKMMAARKGGEGGGERPSGPKEHYHCDSDADEGR
jgi:imidazolonepropionase-like amidohydrolase